MLSNKKLMVALIFIFAPEHSYSGYGYQNISLDFYDMSKKTVLLKIKYDSSSLDKCRGNYFLIIKEPDLIDWILVRNKIEEAGIDIDEAKNFSKNIFSAKIRIKESKYLMGSIGSSRVSCSFYPKIFFQKNGKIWFF